MKRSKPIIALLAGVISGVVFFVWIRSVSPGPAVTGSRGPASTSHGGVLGGKGAAEGPGLPAPRVRDPMHEVKAQAKRLTQNEEFWLKRYPRFKTAWLAKRREHQMEWYKAQRNNVQPPAFPDIEKFIQEGLDRENRRFDNPREIAPEFFDK